MSSGPIRVALAFDRSGAGPSLVLLHPLGADRRVWDPLLPTLREQRQVICFDLPGFGESPPLTGTTPTPRALAGAVATALSALGIERPHIAGNSLGGWVALELGLAGIAETVTAIAPAGLWRAPLKPKAALAHLAARAVSPLAGAITSRPAGRRLLLSRSMARPEAVPARDAAHLVRAYGAAPGFTAANDAMRAGRFEGLDRLPCPVTLVWPEHDRLISRPSRLPGTVRNVELAGCGHVPMWDAPAALAQVLLQSADAGAGAGADRGQAPASAARESLR
jgi:pimeloyl-ACP methyl ester carboxylesterase